ncbi:MAG: carbohydrate kinase family protein [Armatimonadota bacterium]
MSYDFDILALGEVNVDLILAGLPRIPDWGTEVLAESMDLCLGGSTANFACVAAALGLRVALVSWVGQDDFGAFLVAELQRMGVATDHVRQATDCSTGLTVALSGSRDRAFVTALGTIDYLRGAHVSDGLLATARHLHVGSFFLQSKLRPDLPELFRRAHACGVSTSLDVGYDPAEQWDSDLYSVLAETDVFLPNEVEAMAISGKASPEEAAAMLAALGPLAVVKLGSQGSCAHDRTALCCQPGYEVQVVDTTACGDAFNAGFLHGWLQGLSLQDCLRWGNACGGLMATVAGNNTSAVSAEAVASLIRGGGPGV